MNILDVKTQLKKTRGVKVVSVNQQACIGCGNCVAVCEKVFELKQGKSYVKKGQEKSKLPCVKEAAEACPVQAIKA